MASTPFRHRSTARRGLFLFWAAFGSACFATGAAWGAPRADAFLSERREIQLLAAERVRQSPTDYQRVLALAETRLQQLHVDFQVAGGTPPTRLNGDMGELRRECAETQRFRSSGRNRAPAPGVEDILSRRWNDHRTAFDLLLAGLDASIEQKRPESQLYWEYRRAFDSLRAQTERALLYNSPPKMPSLAKLFSVDETVLLKRLEISPRVTRQKAPSVMNPADLHRPAALNVQTFYRALDLVPQSPAVKSGAYALPPSARTVTLRETGLRLVVRPVHGRGVAYIGQTEQELGFDYIAIPPDTAYYFENTGTIPLEIEYVGLEN